MGNRQLRKIKKNFLAALIEASPNAIYLKDEDGRYLMINEKGAEAVGLTVESFIGKTDLEIFPQNIAKNVMELDREVFDGKPHSGEESAGDGITFFSNKFLIEDSDTGERVMAGISTNISELKKTENDLLEARVKAEEANEHKSIFLQNMSHELRTPLNAIIGFSSILSGEGGTKGDNFKENFREYAKLINSSGVHLLSIINDLLDLSKIEAGEQEFSEDEIDVEYVIESCIQTLNGLAKNNNISIKEIIPEGNIIIRGDEKILRQMIYNLLSNALKYSLTENDVTVQLTVANDGGMDIAVIDSGIGMSEEDLSIAMIPFRRASQVKSTDISGTGLGLPLVGALIKLFNGSLEIKSDEGVGTVATLHLPKERSVVS